MRLALVVALAAAEVKIETKPKPCKKFKCFGRKDPAPRSPYFAPRGNGKCPEGASPHLAKCCAERDACATICGITEELCKKAFDECYVRECELVDDFDEHDQCLKDGKIGSDWPWRGGCSWHADEQKKACMCQGRKEAEERRARIGARAEELLQAELAKKRHEKDVLGLQEAIAEATEKPPPSRSRRSKSRLEMATRHSQRERELADRKKAADARKSKYRTGGMKYTAVAMANRGAVV